jgi:effector-binding domain-containing protein
VIVRKKIIIGLSLLLAAFLIWYLLIKKADFIVSFNAKTSTGTVFQGIQVWSAKQWETKKEKYTIIDKKNFSFLQQEMKKDNITMEYIWNIQAENDSITSVSVGIKDAENSLYNRITAPFMNTNFKVAQVNKIKDFKEGLESHLKNFKVRIDGKGTSEEVYVAYIHLKSVMQEKAQTMIANDPIITGFLHDNNIKIIGMPYVEVVNWDLDKETLDFNYCFPINKNTKIINDEKIRFKTLSTIKGLEATYFGNFRMSDKAWLALMDYAQKHNYKLENKPLEHFLTNPFNGGDELAWETKIIIPFAK